MGGRAVNGDLDRSDELRELWAQDEPDPLAAMFNGAWLDTQLFPALEYSVPGILPEGFGLLVAPPKAGKSWLAFNLALACASGGRALGAINVEQRPVLYLALEDGQRRLQSRARRIMRGQPLPSNIHFVTAAQPAQVLPMIGEFLSRYGAQKPLIIVDTLGKARPPRPPGSDLYAWDYAIGSGLKNAIDSVPGATLLAVHHTRKAESADFVDSVSGSQGVAGSADFVLVLARKRHSDDAVLSVTGRDVEEAEYALRTDGGLWFLDGDSLAGARSAAETRREQDRLGDRALEVLAFVNERQDATRASDLAALSIPPDQARKYLHRLAESGRIHKLGRGEYIKSVSQVSQVSRPDESQVSHSSDEDTPVTTNGTHGTPANREVSHSAESPTSENTTNGTHGTLGTLFNGRVKQ